MTGSCYKNTSLHGGGCFHQDGVALHEDRDMEQVP